MMIVLMVMMVMTTMTYTLCRSAEWQGFFSLESFSTVKRDVRATTEPPCRSDDATSSGRTCAMTTTDDSTQKGKNDETDADSPPTTTATTAEADTGDLDGQPPDILAAAAGWADTGRARTGIYDGTAVSRRGRERCRYQR